MLEVLVLKKYAECTSQCAKGILGAPVLYFILNSQLARSLDRSEDRSLGRSLAYSIARSLGRSIARSLKGFGEARCILCSPLSLETRFAVVKATQWQAARL